MSTLGHLRATRRQHTHTHTHTHAETQLQSKLSDTVSYLPHYGVNFMAATIKYAFSMMMNTVNFAAFEVFRRFFDIKKWMFNDSVWDDAKWMMKFWDAIVNKMTKTEKVKKKNDFSWDEGFLVENIKTFSEGRV